MIHTCDSNEFMWQKQGGYYIITTVLSYIKLFLMFPGINQFYCCVVYIQLVQVESQSKQGFVQTPRTPITHCYLQLPTVTHCYLQLPTVTCSYLQIPTVICSYPLILLPVVTHCYIQLPTVTCSYLLLPVITHCHCSYPLLPTVTCSYPLLPCCPQVPTMGQCSNIHKAEIDMYWQWLQYQAFFSNRAAAWIGCYWLLSDISCIVLKFINFRVAKMYGNNRMFYGGTDLQNQQSQSTPIIRGNTYW